MQIISGFWSDDFSQSYGPLKLSIVHIVDSCPGYFSATNDWNSIKLYGKLHYQEEMCTLSAGSRSMIFHRVMAL